MEPRDNSSTKKKPKKAIFLVILGVITALISLALYFFFRPFPGRTNILLLGAAGGDYIAADLTDTVMFVSLDHQTGKVLVLSLPRDIWIPALRTKLNAVYHYRELIGTKETVSEMLGQPVGYGLLINFNLFTRVVDALGRVEVEVVRSFDDYQYPIPGKENDLCDGDPEFQCRYEHIHFEAGKQIMDGETALKYVRSRFAEGEEGTDFARSERQQRLLLAIKNRILSRRVLSSPRKIIRLIKVVLASIETDIPREKYDDLLKLALRFRSKNLQMVVLDEDYLITPPPSQEKYDGQWVLIPKSGDWQEVHEYIKSLLSVI